MALRPVEIAIRAKDQTKAGVQSATTGLERFAAAQAKTNARRRQMDGLVNDAAQLSTAYRQAADRANELGQKIANAKRPSKALREEFAATRAEARRLRDESTQALAAAMRTTGQVGKRGSFAQFDEIARGAKRAEVAVEAETMALNANTGALRRNAAASGQKGKADLASRITGAAASRNDRGPLGLRPYELQNLSYQVNDFFTQIASGTPVTQAFAQQFGQVAQLFPKAISGFIRFIPIIGLAAVALAPFVTKLSQVNNEAKNLKTFELLLTRSGEAATYNAAELAKTAAALDKYGASANEARAAVSSFVTDSVDPGYLERFGKTAIDVSKVLGIDMVDATEKVSKSFTGNVDAIISLDDELNFLTDSERAHILKLKESKKEAEARTYAFGIFERRYQQTANKMKGPWSSILSDFNSAWQSFVNFVNFIDFAKARRQIDDLTQRIQRLTRLLPGANKRGLDNTKATYFRNADELERLREQQAAFQRGNRGRGNVALTNRIALLQREQTELSGLIRGYEEAANAADALDDPEDTTTDPPPIEPDKPDRARTGKSDAEQAAERRAQLLDDLKKSNEARAFELSLIDMQERETRILSEIESERLRFAEEGLALTAAQTKSIRDSVGALYDAEQAARAREQIDRASLELAEARGEIEEEGAFISRKLREAGMESIGEMDEATGDLVVTLTREQMEYGNILRQIYRINEATRQRAEAEKDVNDLTGIRADLMQQIEFYENAGQQATADRLREQLVTVNEQLLFAVDSAINFWTAMGGEGAEAALLRLGLLRDQLNGIGQDALFSGKQINDMIAQGGANAFDQFAQAIAEGENLIGSLRDAFLQFAADFLRQIAQMIIQQAILNALQASSGGGGGGGGGIAGFLNGLFGKAGVKHDGGLIGAGGPSRSVNLGLFAGAMRYHSGGVIGLKPNERPIIAEAGEEMLTEDDPRHRNNLGGGKPSLKAKIVNMFDAPDMLSNALADERGQQVILNFVRNNPSAFKAALG